MEFIFKNKKEAENDVEEELGKARYIDVLTGRGNELQRDFFANYLSSSNKTKLKRMRVILPKIDTNSDELNWIDYREAELSSYDNTYGNDVLKSQIRSTYNYLKSPIKAGKLEVKVFNFPHLSRLILTDSILYLNPYPSGNHGRDSEIIKFRRGGPMYEHYKRVFELYWQNSEVLAQT